MIFFDPPLPTAVPGWWVCPSSILNDRYRSKTCDHYVDRGYGKRKSKCKGAAARYYQATADGKPIEGTATYCLVHFRKVVGEPTEKQE